MQLTCCHTVSVLYEGLGATIMLPFVSSGSLSAGLESGEV